MADRESIHVGAKNDDLRIRGTLIWRLSWRPTGGDIRLPSPSYPEKQHNVTICDGWRSAKPDPLRGSRALQRNLGLLRA